MLSGVAFLALLTFFTLWSLFSGVAFVTLLTFFTLWSLLSGVAFLTLCTIFDDGGGAVGEGDGIALGSVDYGCDGQFVGECIKEYLLGIELLLHLLLLFLHFGNLVQNGAVVVGAASH